MFATDDQTGELGAAWGVKEGLRLLLHTTTLQAARDARTRLEGWVKAADTDETRRLWNTLNTWWPAIEVFITSRVTNARTEAANTAIKHIKRTGDGMTPPTTRLVSFCAAPTEHAASPLDQPRHHGQRRIAPNPRPATPMPEVFCSPYPDTQP